MLPTYLTRRQLFSIINCNRANFSLLCNGNHVPIHKWPIVKCSAVNTILQDKQLPSYWCGIMRHSSSNSSSNSDDLMEEKSSEKEEEEEAANEVTTATIGEQRKLASKIIRYDRSRNMFIIQYKMRKSGQRFINLNKKDGTKFTSLPNILVPNDVFAFVQAMDEVLNAVVVNRDRIEAQTKTNSQNQQESVLHTAKAKGTNKDFELDLCMGQYLYVRMRTVPNENKPEHKSKYMGVPIRVFNGMRLAIGEVFVENGEQAVQQQLGGAPNLPDWLNKVVVSPHARKH